jgi:D-threo-aldose 1-dehydrogenase
VSRIIEETSMPAREVDTYALGHTGLRVPKLCFGTSALGDMPDTYGYEVGEEQAKQTIREVFSGPVAFLDTSRNYGHGRSEERIGSVIRERGGLPDGFVLSTKLDRDPETGRFDGARARRSLEESLEALGLERVHLLHLHDPEHSASLTEIVGPNGALRELFKMRDEGLAVAVGLAAGPVSVMMPLLSEWDFDALVTHNRFTLVNRNAEPMIDFAHGRGIAVLNAAPYGSGVLAKGSDQYARYAYQEAKTEVLEPIQRVEAICRRHSVPVGAVALQFSTRDPRITATICGISRSERIAHTLEWAHWPIPDEVWSELSSVPFRRDDPEASRAYKLG